MPPNRTTDKILKKRKLINREEGEFDDLSDLVEEYENELNEDEPVAGSPDVQYSPIIDVNDNHSVQMSDIRSGRSINTISDPSPEIKIDNIPESSPFLKQKIWKSEPKQLRQPKYTPPEGIKFGFNKHPYLNLWLTVLSIIGAPVYLNSSGDFKSNKLKAILKTATLLTLLVIYHLLFLNSAYHVLETLSTNKKLYDSVWLQIYPIIFNLAVVIVSDVMWIIGLGSNCWMTDILDCFEETPPVRASFVDIHYDYFGGQHKLVNKNEHLGKETRHKLKLRFSTEFMWKLVNFFVRQIVAFGCCFTYLYVSYYLLQPIQLSFTFVAEIINVLLTSCAWLTILWVYMTFCQVLRWRFQHLNDWAWQFGLARSLPSMKQFRILTYIYQHYLNKVTIVDDFFKYWIVGIFGVLFFQTSLYFQYVLNAFENWSPSLQLLVIPLITMPFLSALLLLIKRAADVNAESKELDEIIVKICLRSRETIPDDLYKRIKFFMWSVSEGSSLTIFGLVSITKKFMGSAIVVIFSYTLILHEFTPKESICEAILRNNSTLSPN